MNPRVGLGLSHSAYFFRQATSRCPHLPSFFLFFLFFSVTACCPLWSSKFQGLARASCPVLCPRPPFLGMRISSSVPIIAESLAMSDPMPYPFFFKDDDLGVLRCHSRASSRKSFKVFFLFGPEHRRTESGQWNSYHGVSAEDLMALESHKRFMWI